MNEPMIEEIYEILKSVYDPELGKPLVAYDLIMREWISINKDTREIIIEWFPTTPFCPLLVYISAAIYYVIKKHFPKWKVKVKLHPNVFGANQWNKLLEDESKLEEIIDEMKNKCWLRKFLPNEGLEVCENDHSNRNY